MRAVLAAVACLGVACSKKPAAPAAGSGGAAAVPDAAPAVVDDALPGARWASPLPPFRLPAPPDAVWADTTRLVAVHRTAAGARVSSVDLSTGLVMTGPAHPDVDVSAILQRPSGDLVALGLVKFDRALFVVDPAALTLARRPSGLDGTTGRVDRWAVSASDGTIAFFANGLWTLSADLSTLTAIKEASGRRFEFIDGGKRLLARIDSETVSIELATGTRTTMERSYYESVGDASDSVAILYGSMAVRVVDPITGMTRASSGATDVRGAALLPDGTSFVTIEADHVVLRDTATATAGKRFALPTRSPVQVPVFAVGPRRVAVVAWTAVSVIDLDAAAPRPEAGPVGEPVAMTFDGADVVVLADHQAFRYSETGTRTELGKSACTVLSPSGKLCAWVEEFDDETVAHVVDLARARATTIPIDGYLAETAAVTEDGAVVVTHELGEDGHQVDVYSKAGSASIGVEHDGEPEAFTRDGSAAIVAKRGSAAVLDVRAKTFGALLSAPACSTMASYYLAPDARHVVAAHDNRLTVWDVDEPRYPVHSFMFSVPTSMSTTVSDLDKTAAIVPLAGSSDFLIVVAGGVALWSAANKKTAAMTAMPGEPASLAVDATGELVAVGFRSGRVAVYDLATLRQGTPVEVSHVKQENCTECDPRKRPACPDDGIEDLDGD
jgi:hypothetical protein